MPLANPIEESIKALLLNKVHVSVPSPDTDIVETGLLDSLKLVELLSHLENHFCMQISTEDLEIDNFRSIARIAAFVRERTATRHTLEPLLKGEPSVEHL
jgi:acyl carrier protein